MKSFSGDAKYSGNPGPLHFTGWYWDISDVDIRRALLALGYGQRQPHTKNALSFNGQIIIDSKGWTG